MFCVKKTGLQISFITVTFIPQKRILITLASGRVPYWSGEEKKKDEEGVAGGQLKVLLVVGVSKRNYIQQRCKN